MHFPFVCWCCFCVICGWLHTIRICVTWDFSHNCGTMLMHSHNFYQTFPIPRLNESFQGSRWFKKKTRVRLVEPFTCLHKRIAGVIGLYVGFLIEFLCYANYSVVILFSSNKRKASMTFKIYQICNGTFSFNSSLGLSSETLPVQCLSSLNVEDNEILKKGSLQQRFQPKHSRAVLVNPLSFNLLTSSFKSYHCILYIPEKGKKSFLKHGLWDKIYIEISISDPGRFSHLGEQMRENEFKEACLKSPQDFFYQKS